MHVLLISTILFVIGIATILLNRHNIIRILLGAEMCLLAANWNFLYGFLFLGLVDSSGFILTVLAVAAAEVAVGLGLAVLVFRKSGSLDLTNLTKMSG